MLASLDPRTLQKLFQVKHESNDEMATYSSRQYPKLHHARLDSRIGSVSPLVCWMQLMMTLLFFFRDCFRSGDFSKEEKKEEKTTNFMDGWEMPKEVIVTAWYTMDIPVSHGPENYWGLPGLILEVNDGTTTILCSKIVLNPKEKKEIKAPKNGKVVTQAEFDKIMKEKMEEMREMGGRPGQRSFRMGG